jgi:hypothetical protein
MSQPVHVAEAAAVGDVTLQYVGAAIFAVAVLHTFLVSKFQHIAHKYPEGSVGENLFHLLGETEAVFALWAGVFIAVLLGVLGLEGMREYVLTRNFTEPMFVFVIMCMAATRPIIEMTSKSIQVIANILPLPKKMSFYVTALILGPLLGSFITEPAAMTVTAMVLLDRYFERNVSMKFRYMTIALLFVNVSIGGTLTNFAAPPVLMVAAKWGLTTPIMALMLGYKAAVSIVVCTLGAAMMLKKEFDTLEDPPAVDREFKSIPAWVTIAQIALMGGVVFFSHDSPIFMGVFLMFLAFYKVTSEFHDQLKLTESLMVAAFLGGLVTLGGMQAWWLQPLLNSLGELPLFLGATALTGITDNAALTYLGSLVDGLSDGAKYALLAGAVAGGGLTVIANAPNPAGYGILKGTFGEDGVNPMKLLAAAFPFTLVAMACLWFLPHLSTMPVVEAAAEVHGEEAHGEGEHAEGEHAAEGSAAAH